MMTTTTLPPLPAPAARYVHTRRVDRLIVVSGQIGEPDLARSVWIDADHFRAVATAQAGLAAGRVLAALQAAAPASARVEVVRLGVFIAAPPGFEAYSAVADGASAVIEAACGESTRSARTAVGVAGLPRGALVEVDALAAILEDTDDR